MIRATLAALLFVAPVVSVVYPVVLFHPAFHPVFAQGGGVARVVSPGGGDPASPRLIPAAPGASHYRSDAVAGDRATLLADPLRDAIRAGVRAGLRQKGLPVPGDDPRLDAAMDDLAGALSPDDLPVSDTVTFLLGHHGIIELSPHWLLERVTAGDDREASQRIAADVVDELAGAPAGRLGLGIARTATELHVVVALQEIRLQIQPVARTLAPGRTAIISGRLLGQSHHPQLVVTAPSGAVRDIGVTSSPSSDPSGAGAGPGFLGQVRCQDGPGRYQVEITGVDAGGPAVLANFPLYCGVAPPREAPGPAGQPRAPANAAAAEARILLLVNRDRAAAGLSALAPDGKLADVARAHSRDMATHDFVAHVSPTTGTFIERVGRAGIKPTLLLENVGRAYTADDAHRGFMTSPAHRRNVLDRRATRIGIGVVAGKEVSGAAPLFVTEMMMM